MRVFVGFVRDSLSMFFFTVTFFVLVSLVPMAGFYLAAVRPACEQYARMQNTEVSTQFFGAWCLVKQDGRWLDYDAAVKQH